MTQKAGQQLSIPLDAVNTNNLVLSNPNVGVSIVPNQTELRSPFNKERLAVMAEHNAITQHFANGLKALISDYLHSWPYNRNISVVIEADAEIVKLGGSLKEEAAEINSAVYSPSNPPPYPIF
jgi:hypothetical protein